MRGGITKERQKLGVWYARWRVFRAGGRRLRRLWRHTQLGFEAMACRRRLGQEGGNGRCSGKRGRRGRQTLAASRGLDARRCGLGIVMGPLFQKHTTNGPEGAKLWQDGFGEGAADGLAWAVNGP